MKTCTEKTNTDKKIKLNENLFENPSPIEQEQSPILFFSNSKPWSDSHFFTNPLAENVRLSNTAELEEILLPYEMNKNLQKEYIDKELIIQEAANLGREFEAVHSRKNKKVLDRYLEKKLDHLIAQIHELVFLETREKIEFFLDLDIYKKLLRLTTPSKICEKLKITPSVFGKTYTKFNKAKEEKDKEKNSLAKEALVEKAQQLRTKYEETAKQLLNETATVDAAAELKELIADLNAIHFKTDREKMRFFHDLNVFQLFPNQNKTELTKQLKVSLACFSFVNNFKNNEDNNLKKQRLSEKANQLKIDYQNANNEKRKQNFLKNSGPAFKEFIDDLNQIYFKTSREKINFFIQLNTYEILQQSLCAINQKSSQTNLCKHLGLSPDDFSLLKQQHKNGVKEKIPSSKAIKKITQIGTVNTIPEPPLPVVNLEQAHLLDNGLPSIFDNPHLFEPQLPFQFFDRRRQNEFELADLENDFNYDDAQGPK